MPKSQPITNGHNSGHRLAIVGAGWAGCTAAVAATNLGWQVDLYEAAPAPGGRAKAIAPQTDALDNGQHILLGAYSATLATLRTVGVNPNDVLLRKPLDLRDNNGLGFALPRWAGESANSMHAKSPQQNTPVLHGFEALRHEAVMAAATTLGVLRCNNWPMLARVQLLSRMLHWRLSEFKCHSNATVADICKGLHLSVMQHFIEPLCVSALNLSAKQASGALWLRVLKDALLSTRGSSDLLLPTCNLSTLFVQPCLTWLTTQGVSLHTGIRITGLIRVGDRWRLTSHLPSNINASTHAQTYTHLVLATPAAQAAALTWQHNAFWAQAASTLRHTAIATVYASSPNTTLHWRAPMLALPNGPSAICIQPHQPLRWRQSIPGGCGSQRQRRYEPR